MTATMATAQFTTIHKPRVTEKPPNKTTAKSPQTAGRRDTSNDKTAATNHNNRSNSDKHIHTRIRRETVQKMKRPFIK